MPEPTAACPRCGAPRAGGTECPRCGVIYAKARPPAPRARAEAAPPPPLAPDTAPWRGELDDARLELALRAAVPPLALGVAWVLVSSPSGHALARTFLSMWVHELGHAVAAWLCGLGAFPGPWRTPVSDSRLALVPLAVAAGLGAVIYRGRRQRRPTLVDGGSLVLGTLLMATIYARPESRLRRGALRWGLAGIGATSVVDALDTWLRARADAGRIPLGEIEGVGLSDASKLTEVYGWTFGQLTGRYVALGAVCAAAIAAMYVAGIARARADAAAAARPGDRYSQPPKKNPTPLPSTVATPPAE